MKHLAFAFAAILALSPVPARAQTDGAKPAAKPTDQPADKAAEDGGEKDDKTPKVNCVPIIKKADEAWGKLKSVTFNAHSYGVGGLAFRTPEVSAAVRMVRIGEEPGDNTKDAAYQRRRRGEKEPFEWVFDVKGTTHLAAMPAPGNLLTWYDGEKVRSVREKDKQVVEAAWDQNDEPMNDGAGWALTWAARWKGMISLPFADPEAAAPTRYEGEVIVEGVPCDVVYVDYSETSDPTLFDAWWYIAKSDSLPRRVDIHFIDQGKGDGFSVTVLSDLKADTALDKGALAAAIPQGFETKAIAPPEKRRAAGGGGGGGAPQSSGPKAGQPAPDWALKDAAGKEHKLSDYKGQVVVLDFWATWCGPCRMAMPGVQAIHEKYKSKGVRVFGLDCWESGDAPGYMKEQKFTYGLLLKADEVAGKYGVSGIPTIYVIGADGKVVYSSVGFEGEEALEAAVLKAMKP